MFRPNVEIWPRWQLINQSLYNSLNKIEFLVVFLLESPNSYLLVSLQIRRFS